MLNGRRVLADQSGRGTHQHLGNDLGGLLNFRLCQGRVNQEHQTGLTQLTGHGEARFGVGPTTTGLKSQLDERSVAGKTTCGTTGPDRWW